MKRWCVFIPQDRAFLGVTTLKDLVLKRPQGPMSMGLSGAISARM